MPARTHDLPHSNGRFLRRVKIRNYKSIARCDVTLQPLTLLVGRNGSGKSNFLDALSFVADGLDVTLDHAIQSRGGIDAVRRVSTGHPRNFAIELELSLGEGRLASYGFEIKALKNGGFMVKREQVDVRGGNAAPASFVRIEGKPTEGSLQNIPESAEDRLLLVALSGLAELRPVFDALTAMGFYNLNPVAMRALQSPDAGDLLHRDGSNIASVIARIQNDDSELSTRIQEYLRNIVSDLHDVERVTLGPMETLRFRQTIEGSEHPWKFYAQSMSDGTLRALGALTAVAQLTRSDRPINLVGIEEPETALHPAAAGALMDALREGLVRTQLLVTSHSPDLVDHTDVASGELLVVRKEGGKTQIAPVSQAGVEAVKKALYTPGELLRMDQLEPDPDELQRQEQMKLFSLAASDS